MLTISSDTVCYVIAKVRELRVRGNYPDDPALGELESFLSDLGEDALKELLALVLIGRGDYGTDQWRDALAGIAEDVREKTAVDHLINKPGFADFLEKGLSRFGHSCEDQETKPPLSREAGSSLKQDEGIEVRPFRLARICKSTFDTTQLSLKDVDATDSVYTRTLMRIPETGLPNIQIDADKSVHWDLCLVLKYRQDWRPSGYGLGELLYTTSLLPNEEQTIEIKTWETDRRLEENKQGIEASNTSDIRVNTASVFETTDKLETKERMYVDAKASYSGFGAEASVAAGWSNDVATFNQENARSSLENTRKAANEEKTTKKIKIVLSRESGSEAKNTRRLQNINQTHTLNTNFFEILKEYNVSTHLYDIRFMLLGEIVLMNQKMVTDEFLDGILHPGSQSEFIKWGEIIHNIRDIGWIRALVDSSGRSPVSILRNAWADALRRGALFAPAYGAVSAFDPARDVYLTKMLEFLEPGEGWVEPDERGKFRWAYQVKNGKERDFLRYIDQYRINPGTIRAWPLQLHRQFQHVRSFLDVVRVEGAEFARVTLPTHGVYADVSIGVCSGGEDFVEINRQFDLELKRLEVEKLRLELEKLRLSNAQIAQGKQNELVIEGGGANPDVKIGVQIDAEDKDAVRVR